MGTLSRARLHVSVCTFPPPAVADPVVFGPYGTLGRAKHEPVMDARECKGCRVAWSGDAGELCWHCGQPGRRPW